VKFTVNARDFRDALRGCEKAVSKDTYREVLMYVQIVVTHKLVTLTALDGFQMIQYKMAARDTEFDGPLQGAALVPPKMALTALHSTREDAKVEIEGDQLLVMTDALVTLTLPDQTLDYPKYEKIWPDPNREQYKIAVNAKYMQQIVQACGDAIEARNHQIYLEVPANPFHPIIISGQNDRCTARGLVLPIRDRA
jgi:DNA polymerase III sliding clamp (beta) subunit (PCNA family)